MYVDNAPNASAYIRNTFTLRKSIAGWKYVGVNKNNSDTNNIKDNSTDRNDKVIDNNSNINK